MIELKNDVLAFAIGARDAGLAPDLALLAAMVKLHDAYLEKALAALGAEVALVLEAEDFAPAVVGSAEELFQTVDKFELDLSAHFGAALAYPVLLPYSRSVARLNELVQRCFEEDFAYWQFLLADKGDFALAYAACDRLLCRAVEAVADHFFRRSELTILQRAQHCTNLDYFLRSFGFFRRVAFQLANAGAYNFTQDALEFQFQSESYLA